MKDRMASRVWFDGLENHRKKDDHNEGLDRTKFLHGRQTRAMLFGAAHAKKLDAEPSSTDDWYDVGRRMVKIR